MRRLSRGCCRIIVFIFFVIIHLKRDRVLAQLLDQHAAKLRQVARHVLGADEFINDLDRWRLWLVDAPPALLRSSSLVEGRLKAVRAYRSASKRDRTRQLAARPRFFGEIRQPDARYVLIPRHSSERGEFVQMGYLDPDVICGDAKMWVSTATLLQLEPPSWPG